MSRPPAPMRQPANAAEQAECERAYESNDPFAIARWERPGHKYLLLVDDRQTFLVNGRLWSSVVIHIPPEAPWFEMLPEKQTINIRDHIAVPAKPDGQPDPEASA